MLNIFVLPNSPTLRVMFVKHILYQQGPAPQNPTAPRVIRVPNPNYGSSASTQPQYMEFIPTPGFSK